MRIPARTKQWLDAPFRCPAGPALALCLAILFLAAPLTADAQETLTPPEQQIEELIILAGTYQSCYFNIVAVSCFQLYSSTGIIATDFAQGNIDAVTALGALDHNSLLLTACLTTLGQVREVTPADDHEVRTEIDRLAAILQAQLELVNALTEVCYEPTDRAEATVEACRVKVEAALDAYVGEMDNE